MANSTIELVKYNIKKYRVMNNLTQDKLSELTGISSDYLSEIERGKRVPSLKRLIMIADAMNIPAYKLLMKYPNQKVLFAFNIAVVGFILCRLFHGYEIFIRMFGQMDMYWFVPIGYSFYLIKKYNIKNKSVKLSLFALCIYLIMLWARFVLLNPEAMFFWDCNGFIIY